MAQIKAKYIKLTSAHILVGTSTDTAADVAMSGDIAISNTGSTSYSGTVPLNKGGTGQTTKAPAFDALQPMTTLGDTIYGGASGTGTRLAGNTSATKNFLIQTGNGSVSAAPTWGTIAAGDVPTLNQNTTGTALNITASSNTSLTTLSNLVSIGTITTGTWSATTIALNKGGTGQTTKAAAFDALSPMSASGDVIYGGTSGTGTRLAIGSTNQVLTVSGGLPAWATPAATPTDFQQVFAGDGSTVAFTLTHTPTAQAGCLVLVDGMPQLSGTDFTTSGTTLTLSTTTPAVGQTVFVKYTF